MVKVLGKIVFLLASSFFLTVATAEPLVSVPVNSSRIVFKGARYIQYGDLDSLSADPTSPRSPRSCSFVQPLRFSQSVLKMPLWRLRFNPRIARWPAGVEMHLVTDSRDMMVAFELSPEKRNRRGICQVYRDAEFLKNIPIKATRKKHIQELHVQSEDGKKHHYRVMLPANIALRISSLKIDRGSQLFPVRLPSKPVYVAMGDSITHGSAGIDGISTRSYPYILASLLGYDLYNLGIGGGRVSPPLGTMLKDWEKIDLITLLIGYNDLSWAGVSKADYRKYYSALLKNIRKSHSDTPLFCLTLTRTKLKKSPKSGITPEDYRKIVRSLVKTFQTQGDQQIYLVEGESLNELRDLHDPVHLNVNGNQKVARRLAKIITARLAHDNP